MLIPFMQEFSLFKECISSETESFFKVKSEIEEVFKND